MFGKRCPRICPSTYHSTVGSKTSISTPNAPCLSVTINSNRKNRISEQQLDSPKQVRCQSPGHGCEHKKVTVVHERSAILDCHPGTIFYKDQKSNTSLNQLDHQRYEEGREPNSDGNSMEDDVSKRIQFNNQCDGCSNQCNLHHEIQGAGES
jgi:hypothetical protein